jgi:signal transduction histidine kinase
MKQTAPEPGFVRAYRLFVVTCIIFWLVIGPILIVVEMAENPSLAAEDAASLGLVQRLSLPNVGPALILDVLLLVTLLLPQVQRRLGRWFVPLALIIGLLPLLVGYYWWPSENPLQTPFVMFFFVMLVLIAWEYPFRYVLAYVLSLSLYQGLLSPWPEHVPWTVPLGWLVMQGAMMLLVGYVTGTLVSVQRVQRAALAEAYEQQAAANERLKRYALMMEKLATSRERNRLARELHDTLAHSLSAVTVQLEAIRSLWQVQPEKARRLLEQADETARTGLTEARRALQALRASPLEDLGLALAIRELAETAGLRTGAVLDLDIPDQVGPGLTPAVEQGVYRIAQETLDNVVRHAGARSIYVRLDRQPDGLALTVEDDGQGLDADVVDLPDDNQLGIRGMQERAELIGGQLTISSQAGKGTRVQLTVPVLDLPAG